MEEIVSKDGTAAAVIERLNDIADTYSKDLAAIVENARWLVTLVLAEIAALAGYRHLTGANTLSLAFVLVILFLGTALLLLVITVIVARYSNQKLRLDVVNCRKNLTSMLADPSVSDNDMMKRAPEAESSFLNNLPGLSYWPHQSELWGLVFLLLASLLGGAFLLLSEVVAFFR